MKVQIASDIHLENFFGFGDKNVTYEDFAKKLDKLITPVPNTTLLVAGDVTRVADNHHVYALFIKYISYHWNTAFIITGNHEYYTHSTKATMEQINTYIKQVTAAYPNVSFLDNQYAFIPGTNVILYGTTLWSKINVELDFPIYTDHGKITKQMYNAFHKRALEELEKLITNLDKRRSAGQDFKLVVLSHHAPSHEYIELENREMDDKDQLYSTDLHVYTKKKFIDTWICGHTHSNYDMFANSSKKTRIISNCQPLKPNFVKDLVIDI